MGTKKNVCFFLLIFLIFLINHCAYTITLDDVKKKDSPPSINITSPLDNQTVTTSKLSIIGEVKDDNEVSSVTINGNAISIIPGKKVIINETIKIVGGKNEIVIFALDNKEQKTIIYRTVYCVNAAPLIMINSPLNNQITTEPTITIFGNITDDNGVAGITINEKALVIKIGKKVDFEHTILLQEGNNNINIEAKDDTGNISSQSITVVRSQPQVKRVGEPLRIAVMTFGSKSQSPQLQQVGDILAEMITTALGKIRRFNLVERSELEKVLKEQGLGQSGFVDESTAKKIGKFIAVDAIVTGTFSELTDSLRIDVRMIDTETAKIMITEGMQSKGKSTDDLIIVAEDITKKIKNGIPLIEGKIIKIKSDDKVMIDIGKDSGVIPGMRFVVYREGEEIIINGKNYGREIKVLGEVQGIDIFPKYSDGIIIKQEDDEIIIPGNKIVSR